MVFFSRADDLVPFGVQVPGRFGVLLASRAAAVHVFPCLGDVVRELVRGNSDGVSILAVEI